MTQRHRSSYMSLVVALALMPVLPVHAATPSHESCLTAWATEKGWTNMIPAAFGYRDNTSSYDFSIDTTRMGRWLDIEPFEESRTVGDSEIWTKREDIVTEGGFHAVKTHGKTREESFVRGSSETENWEYFCPDFKVLVGSFRNTRSGQTGSDPQGILEDYLAFLQECLDASPADKWG